MKRDEDIQVSLTASWPWSAKKQIWIAPISGKDKAKALTFALGKNAQPKWSPDGKKIAFVSDRGDHSFVVIYEFGRTELRYVSPSADRDQSPRWSPDGSQIAFIRLVGKQMKQPFIPLTPLPWAVWVYDVSRDSGHEIWKSGPQLDDSLPQLTADTSFQFGAKNRIVFSSEQDGWNDLYSIATTGGRATLLTPGKFETEDVTLTQTDVRDLFLNQDDIDRRHLGRSAWKEELRGGYWDYGVGARRNCWQSCLPCSTATTPAMPYAITSQGRDMIAKNTLPADFPSEASNPWAGSFKAEDGWRSTDNCSSRRRAAAGLRSSSSMVYRSGR
jgi:dipeptidyl aminopeptidase/acylaminoacyl peptidase